MQKTGRIFTAAVLCSAATWAATPATHRSGIDLAGIDHSVKPGDDFDAYANGAWLRTAVIPADRASTGVFLQVFNKAEQRNAELIKAATASKAPAGSNARKIADYYAAFMNQGRIATQGLTPLKPQLARIDAIASRTDLARVLGERLRADVDPINNTRFATENLFGLFVTQGLEDPSHNVAYLLQGGLGMPNRDYYLAPGKEMAGFRTKYQAYIATQFKNAGIVGADTRAKAEFDLETKIAAVQESLVDSEDPHKANNPWSMADFTGKAPGLHLNGQQTLGENIADVSGLTIAWLAYHKSLGGKPAAMIDGLTGDKRFFLAFAQSWREKMRDAATRAQVISNGHSPGRFRAQTVRNLDAWYDAFSPKPGEKLYLAPKDRVKIW